jgi:hypothetical protein
MMLNTFEGFMNPSKWLVSRFRIVRCGAVTKLARYTVALLMLPLLVGCSIIKKKPADATDEFSLAGKTIPPEKAQELLSEVGGNFAYGPGLGDSAVTVATVVLFPPYAVGMNP